MITCELTQDHKIIKEIATNPVLFHKTYGEKTHLHPTTWQVDTGKEYLLVKHNNKIMGMFPFRMVSEILMEVHIYILPKYSQRKLLWKAIKTAIQWAIETRKIKKFLGWTPDNCFHMIKFLTKVGATPCGHVFNAIYYNGEQTGILFYEIEANKYLNNINQIIMTYNKQVQ